KIRELYRVFAIRILEQMRRLTSDDADYVAGCRNESDALSHQHLRVPTADRRDVNEAVVVDVLRDDTDLVDVAVEQDRGTARRIDLGEAVAGHVDAHFVGEGLRLRAPGAAGQRLEAGWSGRVQQPFEKR